MINQDITKMLKIITGRLIQAYHREKMILFGSYAYGEPNEDSDIDILIIVTKSSLPQYKRSRLGYSFLRDIPRPVELIVLTAEEVAASQKVITSLASLCLTKGIILYE